MRKRCHSRQSICFKVYWYPLINKRKITEPIINSNHFPRTSTEYFREFHFWLTLKIKSTQRTQTEGTLCIISAAMSQLTPNQGVLSKCPWMRDPQERTGFLCVFLRLLPPPRPCTEWSLKWSLGVWLKFFCHFKQLVINWTCLFSPFLTDTPERGALWGATSCSRSYSRKHGGLPSWRRALVPTASQLPLLRPGLYLPCP